MSPVPAGSGRLAGRRLLVVGGGTQHSEDPDAPPGNGRAVAVLAAREGAAVAISDISLDAAEATASLVVAEGADAYTLQVDVADAAACVAHVQVAAESLGGLDALVLNVGIGLGRGLADTTADAWDTTFAVNVRAHFLALQAALPLMAGDSSTVLISSLAGLRPGTGIPSYDASKAAQIGLMRHAAREAAPAGRVNVVAPGLIDTPLGRRASGGRASRSTTRIPLGRQGTAVEVAEAVVWLLSAQSSYVTGQVLSVCGGLSTL